MASRLVMKGEITILFKCGLFSRPLRFIAHGIGICSTKYETFERYYKDLKRWKIPITKEQFFTPIMTALS